MDIYGIEKLTLVDYDGYTACILFTGGCNFRCGYCHNAALVDVRRNYSLIPDEEIFDYLNKRYGLLDGVAITGGEPTLNSDLPDFIRRIKDIGYSVKLDSNGTNPQMLEKLWRVKLIDYVAMDIKSTPERYSDVVGIPISEHTMDKILTSIEFLKTSGIAYEFRTTLIAQYHTAEVMAGIADLIAGAQKYAMQRFNNTESCLAAEGLTAVDKARALEYREIMYPKLSNILLRGF